MPAPESGCTHIHVRTLYYYLGTRLVATTLTNPADRARIRRAGSPINRAGLAIQGRTAHLTRRGGGEPPDASRESGGVRWRALAKPGRETVKRLPRAATLDKPG